MSPWTIVGRKKATTGKREVGVTTSDKGIAEPREDMRCMACKKKAGTLVLIRNRETDEILQVGKECLKKYMGYEAELMSAIAEEEPLVENEWETSGFKAYSVSLALFLSEAKKDITERGYIKFDPYADNYKDEKPTKQIAWWEACSKSHDRAKDSKPLETKEELSYLKKIRKWAKEKDASKSDFWKNVQNILKGDSVRKEHVGFIACLPDILRRDKERAAAKAKQEAFLKKSGINNEDFAPVDIGTKIDIEAIIERKGGYDSIYGWTDVFTFRGKDGFVYVWKTKVTPMWKIPIKDAGSEFFQTGDKIRVKGTVKEKSVYKDIHQTILTRCKLEMIEPKETPVKQKLLESKSKMTESPEAEKALDELFESWN